MSLEYDNANRQLRDLRVSFLIDEPVKMWLAEVAAALARRGYFLSSIETIPVTGRIATYLSDLGEGTATFEGDAGQICVAKRGRHWTLGGDAAELELYGLSKAFESEDKFKDAVSCYILAKRNPKR